MAAMSLKSETQPKRVDCPDSIPLICFRHTLNFSRQNLGELLESARNSIVPDAARFDCAATQQRREHLLGQLDLHLL